MDGRTGIPLRTVALVAACAQVCAGLVAGFATLALPVGAPASARLFGALLISMSTWTLLAASSRHVALPGARRRALLFLAGGATAVAGLWVLLPDRGPGGGPDDLTVPAGIAFLGTSVGYFVTSTVEGRSSDRQVWIALATSIATFGVVLLVVPVPSPDAAHVLTGSVFVGLTLVAAAGAMLLTGAGRADVESDT